MKILAHGKMPGCGLAACVLAPSPPCTVHTHHAICPPLRHLLTLHFRYSSLNISSEVPVKILAHGKMPGCGLAACVLAPSPPFTVHTCHAICPPLRHLLTLNFRYGSRTYHQRRLRNSQLMGRCLGVVLQRASWRRRRRSRCTPVMRSAHRCAIC